MTCIGDGWHRVGTNCKVHVNNRVIDEVLVLRDGEWVTGCIEKWNKRYHRYQRVGMVTLAALRSGIVRSTMTVNRIDIVTITCYGKTEKLERHEAIKQYTEAVYATEGAAKDHYDDILSQLVYGRSVCTDQH